MTPRQALGLVLFFVVLSPMVASGVDGQPVSGGFSFMSSLLQMFAALLLVLGLIMLVYYLLTRLMRRLPVLGAGKRYIRVIETHAVGSRKALMLVEVAGEYLLLSNSGEQLSLIKQVDLIEEVELFEEENEYKSFLALLRRAGSGGLQEVKTHAGSANEENK